MITITEEAAKQIKLSAKQGKAEGMPLRIAATRNEDDSITMAWDSMTARKMISL